MTCYKTPIIGATCDDQINYGETVDLEFTYQDESGNPLDLTTAAPSIFSSSPAVIKDNAVLTIADAPAGKMRLFLSRDDALQLRRGRNNRFRIQMIFGSQSDDVTPDIYIQVSPHRPASTQINGAIESKPEAKCEVFRAVHLAAVPKHLLHRAAACPSRRLRKSTVARPVRSCRRSNWIGR